MPVNMGRAFIAGLSQPSHRLVGRHRTLGILAGYPMDPDLRKWTPEDWPDIRHATTDQRAAHSLGASPFG